MVMMKPPVEQDNRKRPGCAWLDNGNLCHVFDVRAVNALLIPNLPDWG
jgi:hypothetical protein